MVINLHNLGFSNGVLDLTPKHKQQKKKQVNWISLKLQTFCIKRCNPESEKTAHRMEENMCTLCTDESLTKLHQELLQLINKKTNNPILKMDKGLEQTVLHTRHTNGQGADEKMSNFISHDGNAK